MFGLRVSTFNCRAVRKTLKQSLLVWRKLLIQVKNFKHFWILFLHSIEQEVSSVEEGAEPGCNKHKFQLLYAAMKLEKWLQDLDCRYEQSACFFGRVAAQIRARGAAAPLH